MHAALMIISASPARFARCFVLLDTRKHHRDIVDHNRCDHRSIEEPRKALVLERFDVFEIVLRIWEEGVLDFGELSGEYCGGYE